MHKTPFIKILINVKHPPNTRTMSMQPTAVNTCRDIYIAPRQQQQQQHQQQQQQQQHDADSATVTIVPLDFSLENFMMVCKKIRLIFKHELIIVVPPVGAFSFVEFGKVEKIMTTDPCYESTVAQRNTQYVAVKIPYGEKYITNGNGATSSQYVDFLFGRSVPARQFFANMTNMYPKLLRAATVISNNGILMYNVSHQHIAVSSSSQTGRMVPGRQSIMSNRLDIDGMCRIISDTRDFTGKPLEVFMLHYICVMEYVSISYATIETISRRYVDEIGNVVLCFLSPERREQYYLDCVDCLRRYINKPRDEIVLAVIRSADSWDNCGLSLLHAHILGKIIESIRDKSNNMSKTPVVNIRFLTRWFDLMCQNIDPFPERRLSMIDTFERYSCLFADPLMDWSGAVNMDISAIDRIRSAF